MISALKSLSRYAAKHDVVLGLENMECFSILDKKLLITAHYGSSKLELLDITNNVNNPF